MSGFDPQLLLNSTTTEVSERRNPLPVGDYLATIGEITARTWSAKDGSKTGKALDVKIVVQVPAELQGELELPPTLTLNDSIMLDLTPNDMIDYSKGKNSRLRVYREALDMNKAGEPYSPLMMQGRIVTVRIKHEEYEGWPQERVGGIAAAA